MDCLRSFNFNATVSGYVFSNPLNIKTWTLGLQEYFVFDDQGSVSLFNIAGFKNINVFGCSVVGNVQADIQPTGGGILEDWNIGVRLNGQTPLISGSVDPVINFWNLTTTGNQANTFELGRHTPSVKFNTPFQSVRTIEIVGLKGQGYGGQTIGALTLDIDLNFIFYYQYEGE